MKLRCLNPNLLGRSINTAAGCVEVPKDGCEVSVSKDVGAILLQDLKSWALVASAAEPVAPPPMPPPPAFETENVLVSSEIKDGESFSTYERQPKKIKKKTSRRSTPDTE